MIIFISPSKFLLHLLPLKAQFQICSWLCHAIVFWACSFSFGFFAVVAVMMNCFLRITPGCLGSILDSCACFKVSIYFRKSDNFLLGQFSLGQMQLEMQILQTRILTIEPILLMISHWFSCRLGTPTTIGLSLIMEPSALTRTFRHIFGIRMSRSNAIKLCVHIT